MFKDFLTRMTKAAGFTLPDRQAPGWVVRAVAFASEAAWRGLALGGRPPLTRFTANILSRDCVLVDAKARREMGYAPPFTIEAGLAALTAERA